VLGPKNSRRLNIRKKGVCELNNNLGKYRAEHLHVKQKLSVKEGQTLLGNAETLS
jgi:hypothetical protein